MGRRKPVTSEDFDIWRQIPPEEKLSMMNHAHASGFRASVIGVCIGATCAVALQIPWLLWISLIGSPFVFQFFSSKTWRHIQPTCILRYLAARSAARRYAFTAKAKELSLQCILRGKLEKVYDRNDIQQALEATVENVKEVEVWIALFKDTIVMLSEHPGGARSELAYKLNKRLQLKSESESGEEYGRDRAIHLTVGTEPHTQGHFRITSPHPAALIVLEKKLSASLQQAERREDILRSGSKPKAFFDENEQNDSSDDFDFDP